MNLLDENFSSGTALTIYKKQQQECKEKLEALRDRYGKLEALRDRYGKLEALRDRYGKLEALRDN
jgi:hypothetical protein